MNRPVLTTRTQQESRLLGIIIGAITSFSLVLIASLLPWFDGEDQGATSQPAALTAPAENSSPTDTLNTPAAGANSQGRGGGPPEGRGPRSQNDPEANADPMTFGVASQEVRDAFAVGGCVACHSIKGVGGGDATIGPHLFRIGFIAADRRPGASAAAYIEESILNPDAFIMPNCPTGACPSGLMPTTYAETLSAADLSAIVDYLAALGTSAEQDVLSSP